MGRYTGKTCRLISMLTITFSFFVVEIVVGYIVNSIALVADSFHMLSDVVALIVGLASVRIARKSSKKNTFGWARAEVLGALFNAVFLVALCFSIFVEALQRLIENEKIEDPKLMLIVGGLGLLINIVGLFLFRGGHGHSHGGGGEEDSSEDSDVTEPLNSDVPLEVVSVEDGKATEGADGTPNSNEMKAGQTEGRDHGHAHKRGHGHSHGGKKASSAAQLNMRGVFLHVLGDALGSVIVIISALVIWFVEDESWKYKVDPAMSILLVCIILSTTIPLLKESALILLQTAPTHIRIQDIQEKLIKNVPGVLAIHEFHVWQLTGNRIIATGHIQCLNLSEYKRIAEDVKQFFHNEGIHSTTIQPEFLETGNDGDVMANGRACALECGPGKPCFPNTCCARKENNTTGSRDPSQSPDISDTRNGTPAVSPKVDHLDVGHVGPQTGDNISGDVNTKL